MNCGYFYPIFNLFVVAIVSGIFFGVYFGLFNYTMQYHLQEAQDCKVIGRYNTSIRFIFTTELYSALYINFTLDGEQYLGYGCLSSCYDIVPPNVTIDLLPYSFYYYCPGGECTSIYLYNQVKLPSWMCLPFDIDHEELINHNKCYVNFFNNGSNGKEGPAYTHARNRDEINTLNSFALTTFSKISVPYDQYLWLLMVAFCPIFPSVSIAFFNLTKKLDATLINLPKQFEDELD